MEYIIGIDDAGRGPVIGPMVLCGMVAQEKDNSFLIEMGVKDSKQIPPKKRVALAKDLTKMYKYHVEITPAADIDASINSGINLNWIEAIKTGMIINKLVLQLRSEHKEKLKIKVYVDCPSVNIRSWRSYLWNCLTDKDLELIAEHKADVNYPVVSGASVIGKVVRDKEIERINEEIGKFGSGYPSDPNTIKFLKENKEKLKDSPYVRKSWQTWKDIVGDVDSNLKQKKLF